MKRKYLTEFCLHVVQSNALLLFPTDLKVYEFNQNANYHIYMIHKIPKIFVKKDSIKTIREGIFLELCLQKKDEIETYPVRFSIDNEIDHTQLNLKCDYPYNKLTIFKDGEVDLIIRSFILYNKLVNRELDLEILYIGQSFGNEGERKAYHRLGSHSTLQKVLSDISMDEPDKDVILSLWEFDDLRLLTTMDGISKDYMTTDEEDTEHLMQVLSHENNFKQVINITEAALINYFKPYYNEKFVDNFPTSEHQSYQDYYHLDFSELCIEIFPDEMNVELFSEESKYNIWECIKYKLDVTNKERKGMFDIFS